MSDIVSARSGRKRDYIYMRQLGLGFKDNDDFRDFFGCNEPKNFYRDNLVEEALKLNYQNFDDDTPDLVVEFYKKLESVVDFSTNEESSTNDLGKSIFSLLGYNRDKRIFIHGPTKIEYLISGVSVQANPDIAIQDKQLMYLLVQEDKSYKVTELDEHNEAEPQLVAEMVGAYYNNVDRRKGNLENQTLYGIVMLGTHCTFYKFRITTNDLIRITEGKKVPEVCNYIERYSVGEKDPGFLLNQDNLLRTLRCYEALRIGLKDTLDHGI